MRYSSICIYALAALLLISPAQAASIRGGSSPKALNEELERRKKQEKAEDEKRKAKASNNTIRKVKSDAIRKAAIEAGPLKPSIDQSKRTNFPDPKTNPTPKREGAYPWHFDITATYFYIGELPTKNNPTPNTASSWDSAWDDNYGGFDDPNPENRDPVTFCPKGFTPRLNPFYVALPYNDIQQGGPKPEASRVIPWYRRDKEGKYESVCRGMWVQIYYNGKYCFAQWEDCGPFVTDDWQYVFGGARPKNDKNKAAGIDISPAVRDYLGIPGGMAKVHWRFVDFHLVPGGPWAKYGKDNPFINPTLRKAIQKYELHRRNQRLLNKGKYSSR